MAAKPQQVPLSGHPGGRETGHACGTSPPRGGMLGVCHTTGSPERPGEGCGVSDDEMQGHQKEPPRTNSCASTHCGAPAVTAVGAGILAEWLGPRMQLHKFSS